MPCSQRRMRALETVLVSYLSRHAFNRELNSDGPGSQLWETAEVDSLSDDSEGDMHGARVRTLDLNSGKYETFRLILVLEKPAAWQE